MIFFLFGSLPAAFLYTSTRMILAAITSLIISIFIGPWFIRKLYELKIGQPIRKEECPLLGELHHKKQDTPTMGGILIIFSILVSMALWMDWQSPFTLILLITTIVLSLIGGRDDYLKLKKRNTKGLSGKKKLLFQGLLAAFVAAYLLIPAVNEVLQLGDWFAPPVVKEEMAKSTSSVQIPLNEYASRIYLPFFKEPVIQFSPAWAIVPFLFMVFVIVGSSNAVNLTDGLDGLASGCVILVAATLSVFAFISNHSDLAAYLNILYVEGASEIAVYLTALCGACLGFLWYNGHPAQVFMGDIGSLTLGGIIGVSAVLLKRELLLGLIGIIFVSEALSVILQVISFKFFNQQRIFLCAPLHHHFEYKGWPETKVVIRFWIIGLLFALIGLASIKFQ